MQGSASREVLRLANMLQGILEPSPTCCLAKGWPEGLAVRRCEARDAADLYDLFNSESYQRSGALLDPFSSPDAVAEWLDSNKQNSFQVVGLQGGSVVGFSGLYPLQGKQSHAGLVSIGIKEAFHRRGYGRALLRMLIATADLLAGLTRLQLIVLAENTAAISLYEECGFVVEGRHIGFVVRDRKRLDAFTMARIIDDPAAAPRLNQ